MLWKRPEASEPEIPMSRTFMFRANADGTVHSQIFLDDDLADLGSEWVDSPAKCDAPLKAAAPVGTSEDPPAPDEFDAMDREALDAAVTAAGERKPSPLTKDDTLRDKLRALKAAAPVG